MIINEIDVIRTLTKLLESNFNDIAVNDKDQKEGFTRPSFYIYPLEMDDSKIGEMLDSNNHYVIEYFAPDRDVGFLQLLTVKDSLRKLLAEPVKIILQDIAVETEQFHITFDNTAFHLNHEDKTMECLFSVQMVQDDWDHYAEYEEIENLQYTLTDKGDELSGTS